MLGSRLGLTPSQKSPLLRSEDSAYAHRGICVPHMVYPQSTRYRSDRTTTCLHRWIQSGLGNGREPHVVHQQLGHAYHVSMPRLLLSPHLTLNKIGTHQTLRLGQGHPLQRFGHSFSHSPWHLLSYV